MAVCDGPWRMTLGNDRTGTPVVVLFRNITVNGTNFTGEVLDDSASTRLSALTGTCEDLGIGNPPLTRITFQFSLPGTERVGIFLAGVGFKPQEGNALFYGRFRAYAPDRHTPTVNAEAKFVAGIDVGDTGTGNGMQAM